MKAFTNKISVGDQQEDYDDQDKVKVETYRIHDREFLTFSIFDKGLITSQVTGSNALIFFLDADTPLYDEKEFLFELMREKADYEGLPIVIVFDKDS